MLADGLVQLSTAPSWSPGDVYRELAHGVAASTTPPGSSLARFSSGREQARHCWLSGRRAARGALLAFLATLRTVVDPGGEAINATDKLPVMVETPTTIVWGGRDRLIPVQHGRHPHRAIPSSRLEISPKAGHFPHLEEPRRFAGLLVNFVEQTEDRLVQTAVPPATDRRVPAWAAAMPTRRCRTSSRSRRRATDTAPGAPQPPAGPNGLSRYGRGAGVAGAFAGGPTRCPGIRLDVGEALGGRRSRRMPVAERGRRNQSEVSAPAMLRWTSAPQCRVFRRSRGSASSAIGDKAVHSCGCADTPDTAAPKSTSAWPGPKPRSGSACRGPRQASAGCGANRALPQPRA